MNLAGDLRRAIRLDVFLPICLEEIIDESEVRWSDEWGIWRVPDCKVQIGAVEG